MKQLLGSVFLFGVLFSISAQSKKPTEDLFNFVPGQIIVKLKDDVKAKVTYDALGKGTAQVDVAALLGIAKKVKSTNMLFTEKAILRSIELKRKKAYDYKVKNPKTLKNVFLLKLNDENENILGLAEELKNNKNVEYVEPNYNFSVNDFTIESEIIYPKSKKSNSFNVTPDDPLYTEQSNISAVKIDQVWNTYGTGDGSQTIAILDTGVDYTHPDLEPNIWINQEELNGVEGFDDDGNGYIDDIRGWDFINLDNAPLDDNMHGTHVAGIAGALGGNGIGIAGAAWNVKLMPIKVFQSNGVGNSSTIAEGVTYASVNGATILNMSFGSYAESSTLRIALENAYASAVLVAAAGNDGVCIGPGLFCAPFYPAAYTYVLGIEDRPKPPIGYTNYDQDGPIFSRYSNLLNYELAAPGTSIMSTVPNGGYRKLTGTSMSAPLVAGGIALYNQEKPEDSKELLFGNLINTAETYVDFEKAITVEPTPELQVLSAITKDTINGQNGNDFLEPGETVEILPLVKNYWGPTEDVRVGIEFAEFEDQSKATILEEEIAIGSITAYATLQDLTMSLKIQLADGIANNVNIKFNLMVWSGPNQDYLSKTEFVINVKNSILLFGLYEEDLTLYADKEYLVSDNFAMAENTTLTIEQGVELNISDGKTILINGNINAIGTRDNRIIFAAENIYWAGMTLYGESNFKYCIIKNVNGYNIFNNQMGSHLDLEKCVLTDNYAQIKWLSQNSSGAAPHSIRYSNIVENLKIDLTNNHSDYVYEYTNFINNSNPLEMYISSDSFKYNNIMNNMFNDIGVNPLSINFKSGTNRTLSQPNYLGTGNIETAASRVIDFFEDGSRGIYSVNYATEPSELTNGIVWKVLVNGLDAQDEYDQMDPVGVGTHEFRVYFNREMDQTKPPQISYGVREPYTQKIITEEGTWSADGKIYTVSHEVKIGAADGINRIRVQGARDLDYFEIPIEDSRFNMLIQSAGSASTGFAAEPGLGKITLNWDAPSEDLLNDALGYNMYRYMPLTDSTFTEATKINESLITDTHYEDFDVEEGTRYFYKYKILRTSFKETDFSKTVTTEPLTSKLGDANGDDGVNVMDLVQNVDYILGNNPKPFIFSAADVNNDDAINVLDIVGIVDIILNPSADKVVSKTNRTPNYYPTTPVGDAIFFWEGDDLYVESDHEITGLQLAFDKGFLFQFNTNLPKFESLQYQQEGYTITMLYSFGDIRIPKGKTKLLTKSATLNQEFAVEKAVVGTTNGRQLNPKYEDRSVLGINSPEQGDQSKVFTIGPNPTSGLLNIFYYLPEQMDKVLMTAYDVQGKRVWHHDGFKNTVGQSSTQVNLTGLPTGVYFLSIDVIRAGQIQKREVKRILIQR